MHASSVVSGALFAGVLCVSVAVSASDATVVGPPGLAGRYRSTGDADSVVTVTTIAPGVFRAVAAQWEGVGLFDGTIYWGVFQLHGAEGPKGTHRGVLRPDGSLAVHGAYNDRGKTFDVIWARQPDERKIPLSIFERRAQPPDPPPHEKLDEYAYVEELPKAVKKVPPVYPDIGINAEGTVLVQVLVGTDGRVKDTRVVKSIPMLDEPAVTAVRQWQFKPALSKGKPVAVWVAVPVKFSLH